jgi:methylase of polypeptide subunit release factors
MNPISVDETLSVWAHARDKDDRDCWVEHLDRVPVCDFFPVLAEQEALTRGSKLLSLSQWLNYMGERPHGDVNAELESRSTPAHVRLATATFQRWVDRVETLLRTSRLAHLPPKGVVQYFADHLAASILIGYRKLGTGAGASVELNRFLAMPNPDAYLDPLRALRVARTPSQLDLLRRSLYTRHKVVIQRNTLIHIDRERADDVFGPTIDTLFLNDWLHVHRYSRQRTLSSARFFEDPVSAEATADSRDHGQTFLEIGCGNGLLTASFVRNEARVRSFGAIDVSHNAISATFENVEIQRQLHRSSIAARGRFTIGSYDPTAVPNHSDLVVCNPPYVPKLPAHASDPGAHPLTTATVGTDLLQRVLRDCRLLTNEQGELFMISSTLAEPEIRVACQADVVVEKVASRMVPLDLEAVRGPHSKEHIEWLRTERGLDVRVDGSMFHNIAIYRVARQEVPSAEQP